MTFSFCAVCLSSQMLTLSLSTRGYLVTPIEIILGMHCVTCNLEHESSRPFAYVEVDFTSTTTILIVASVVRQIVGENNYCILFPGKVSRSSLARRSGRWTLPVMWWFQVQVLLRLPAGFVPASPWFNSSTVLSVHSQLVFLLPVLGFLTCSVRLLCSVVICIVE